MESLTNRRGYGYSMAPTPVKSYNIVWPSYGDCTEMGIKAWRAYCSYLSGYLKVNRSKVLMTNGTCSLMKDESSLAKSSF